MVKNLFRSCRKFSFRSRFSRARSSFVDWKPGEKDYIKRPSPFFFLILLTLFLISQFAVPTIASEARDITKSSSADFDLGANNNTLILNDEITPAPTSSDWYDNAWKYRREIVIDHSQVPENNTDFPILIKIDDENDPVFSNAQEDGDDILFTDSTENTKIPHEIENFDASGKELWAWVKIPSLSSSVNTVFYMYYGNTDCANQQDKNNVWTNNYIAVWHMSQDSGQILDSTSNGRNGTAVGGPTYSVDGKINKAIAFDGVDDYFYTSAPTGLTSATIEIWGSIEAVNESSKMNMFAYASSSAPNANSHDKNFRITTSGRLSFYAWPAAEFTGSTDLNTGAFQQFTANVGSAGSRIYLNGAQDGSAAATTSWTGGTYFHIGGFNKTDQGTYFNGILDEVRVSSVQRSAGWINTEYNNQNSPETFMSIKQESGYYPKYSSTLWHDSEWTYRQKTTIDHTQVASSQTDFPVLVSITNSSNPIFEKSQDSGNDIFFAETDGRTKLSHELAYFDKNNHIMEAWVKIPSLSSSQDTEFYIYYGNQDCESQESIADTWTNGFAAVYHLNESSGSPVDSTANAVGINAVNTPTYQAEGKIGKAMGFNGTNQYLKSTSVQFRSFQVWLNTNVSSGWHYLMDARTGSPNGWIYADGIGSDWSSMYVNGSSTTRSWSNIPMGNWGHLYFENSATRTDDVNYFSKNTNVEFLSCFADEIRLLNTTRSAGWLQTEYNNQNSPTSFLSLSDQEVSASHLSPAGPTDGSGVIDMIWNMGWVEEGAFSATVDVPANASISFFARSSSVGGSSNEDWTDWQSLGTATSSGIFSVSGSNIPEGLTVGANRYIQVAIFLSSENQLYDGALPSVKDYSIRYLKDVGSPENPTLNSANLEENTITNGSWFSEGGNATFSFSGATDSESGVAGYYLYLGANSEADPASEGSYQVHNGSIESTQVYTKEISTGGMYYLRIKTTDGGENTSDPLNLLSFGIDKNSPTRPAYITADPPGYSSSNSFSFSWPEGSDSDSGIQYYQYKRAVDIAWAQTAGSDDKSVLGLEAYQEGPNAFYVRSVDNVGNISTTYTQVTYYWSGSAPPKPNNLTVTPSSNDENLFTFTWDKPNVGSGSPIIGYYYSINSPPTLNNSTYVASEEDQITIGPDKFATQQGENTIYVVSRDAAGNSSFLPAYYSTKIFNCSTPSPPAPSSASIYDSSDKVEPRYILTIQWQAGSGQNSASFSHYLIERSTDGSSFSELSTVTDTTSYIDDGELSDQTTYYYRIKSVDNAGSVSAASSIVSKRPSGKYTSPPTIIAGPNVEAKASQAVISWTTNRQASSFVRYGTRSSDMEESKGDFGTTTEHSVTLTGLTGNTRYYFQIQSVDAERDYSLDSAYSTTGQFSTLASPSISNVAVSNITLNSADVSWDTTTVASSQLNIGATKSYGRTIEDISGQSSTKHSVKVTDLQHSSSYHFKIVSTDVDGIEITSDDYSFDTQPMPKISDLKVEEIGGKSTQTLKIRWTTNVPTSSIIQYSTGSSSVKEKSKSKMEEEHEIELDSLLDDSKYSIVAKGSDQFGNSAVSEAVSYQTSLDTRKPKISNLAAESQTIGLKQKESSQMIISWVTDEPCTSQILYGEGTDEATTMRSLEDNNLKNNHLVIVTGLKSNNIYNFKAVSKDKAGNETSSDSQIIVAGEVKKSVVTTIIEKLKNIFGWVSI